MLFVKKLCENSLKEKKYKEDASRSRWRQEEADPSANDVPEFYYDW